MAHCQLHYAVHESFAQLSRQGSDQQKRAGLNAILAVRMRDCQVAIADLGADPDIAPEELELRLSQYAQSATGSYCPEVAFDPVAICLRFIAESLGSAPEGRRLMALWNARVEEAVSCAWRAADPR